jgi:CRISPR-associated protein Cas1
LQTLEHAETASPHPASAFLFDRLCAIEQLELGWARVRERSQMPGSDGIGLDAFAADVDHRLTLLAMDLRGGRYRPVPARFFLVPKRHGGGERQLGVLAVADRIVQSALALLIGPLLEAEFEDSSHAYRPGRSVLSAARQISALYRDGWSHVVEADVRAYFDSVPHAALHTLLERYFPDPRLLRLFDQWMKLSAFDGRGLVQGAPISPLLANLYLDRIDEAIAAHGARIVRFADDFVILARTREKAERLLHFVGEELAGLGLDLNPDKSGITDFDHGFAFLGKRFLKSFVMEDGNEADLDAWDDALHEALPDHAGQTSPVTLRRFRATELQEPITLPARPLDAPLPPPWPDQIRDGLRALSPRTRALHLYGRGRRLTARDNAFVVEELGREIWLCGADAIDRVDLGPQASLSESALRFAVRRGVGIRLTNGFGATVGEIAATIPGAAERHLAQARHVIEPDLRLALARAFVAGKIANQGQVVKRWRNNHRPRANDAEAEAARRALFVQGADPIVRQLAVLEGKAKRAADQQTLLGYEGAASKLFLGALREAMQDVGMRARSRCPALDAPNAVLNWLSHLLARDVAVAIDRHGLHPGFGHLHAPAGRRASLAFDLMEELRAPIIEAGALTLFNSKTLQAHDFSQGTDADPVQLSADARDRLIHYYEGAMMRERLAHSDVSGATSWRGVIEAQVRRYIVHIEGQRPYVPYRAKA